MICGYCEAPMPCTCGNPPLKCSGCGRYSTPDNPVRKHDSRSQEFWNECEQCKEDREIEEADETAEWEEPSLSDSDRNGGREGIARLNQGR